MKKFNRENINVDYLFFVFVAFVASLFFWMSGVSMVTCFITGLFVYFFLRFCYFVWNVVLKFFSVYHGTGGGK